jgi:O-antigen ligase
LVKQKTGGVFDFVIKYELLLLAAGIPVLVLPRSYLWKWQQGLSTYAPLGDEAAPGLSPLTWAALGLVALPWLLHLIRQGRLSQRTPLDWPIALTLLTAAIGLWPSVDPLFSLERFLGLVAGVALYYGLVNSINSERQLGRLLALFLAGGAALALLGFAQTDWTAVKSPLGVVLAPVYRALAGLPKLGPKRLNVSVLAGTLIIFVPLALCLLLAPIRRRYKPFLALVALLATGYAVLGWSHGDLLALALALLLLPAFVSHRWRILLLTIVILALLTFAILLTFHPANPQYPISNIQPPTSNFQPPTSNFQPPASNLLAQLRPSRWQVWTRALLMIRDYPFTGIGLDTFRLIAQNEYPYFNYAFNQTEHPHNLFLQAGVDGGVLGLLALVWLVVAFYRTTVAYRRSQIADRTAHIANRKPVLSEAEGSLIPNPQYPISNIQSLIPAKSQDQSLLTDHCSPITAHWSLITGLSASFTVFLIGSLFDNGVMSGPRAALVVWAVLGLQVAGTALSLPKGCKSQVASRRSQVAGRKSQVTSRKSQSTQHATRNTHHASRITFYVSRFTFHASRNTQYAILTSAIILLLTIGYLSYPIVASTYYDNLGCVERGRGWLWREASEEQRRAYARSALAHFQRALALWPGNAAAQRHLGTLYFHAQYPQEAVARLQGMPGAGYHPDFLAFYDEVAKVMDAEAPLHRLERAVALAPYDFLAHFFLAEAYRADGRVAEAVDQYTTAGVPGDRVLWDAERRCRGNTSTAGAIVEYEIAAQLDPHNASCQVKLGDLYRDAGRAEDAKAAYETALVLRPDDEYVRRQLAQLP